MVAIPLAHQLTYPGPRRVSIRAVTISLAFALPVGLILVGFVLPWDGEWFDADADEIFSSLFVTVLGLVQGLGLAGVARETNLIRNVMRYFVPVVMTGLIAYLYQQLGNRDAFNMLDAGLAVCVAFGAGMIDHASARASALGDA